MSVTYCLRADGASPFASSILASRSFRPSCTRDGYPEQIDERAEHLTHAQKAQLEAELGDLEGPRRAEVVDAIKTARAFGDLSENFEYHAAKNEQGLLERRIAILRDRLNRSVLVEEAAPESRKVAVGSRVTLEGGDGETMNVEISSVGGVSPESPLGRALMGATVGDEIVVEAPAGAWGAKIISVGS
jgi:transcription elongation factor GreA